MSKRVKILIIRNFKNCLNTNDCLERLFYHDFTALFIFEYIEGRIRTIYWSMLPSSARHLGRRREISLVGKCSKCWSNQISEMIMHQFDSIPSHNKETEFKFFRHLIGKTFEKCNERCQCGAFTENKTMLLNQHKKLACVLWLHNRSCQRWRIRVSWYFALVEIDKNCNTYTSSKFQLLTMTRERSIDHQRPCASKLKSIRQKWI